MQISVCRTETCTDVQDDIIIDLWSHSHTLLILSVIYLSHSVSLSLSHTHTHIRFNHSFSILLLLSLSSFMFLYSRKDSHGRHDFYRPTFFPSLTPLFLPLGFQFFLVIHFPASHHACVHLSF